MRAHTPVFATAFAALTLATAACSDDSTAVTQPELSARRVVGATSVSVTPSDTSVAAGQSVQLVATGTDRKGSAVPSTRISWSSSDTTIAVVSGGLVTGRAAGSVTITAQNSGATAASTVTVIGTVGGTTTPTDSTPTTTPAPTPTPTPTDSTPTTSTPAPSGPYVTVAAGQSIQAAVDANPGGTQFLIKAGTYSQQTIAPKSGDVFVGEAGAVLDGGNSATVAFDGSNGSSNVTIKGLKITRYASSLTGGTIAGDNTTNWVLSGNEISFGGGVGVRMGVGMQVLQNNIHDNRHTGIDGTKSNGALVEGNTIANNATAHSDVDGVYGDAAGMKIFRTQGVVVRNNVVRDNWGPGIWYDTDNVDAVIEGNTVTGNTHRGIMYEISYGGIIRNNVIQNNGFGVSASWISNAGIFVVSSSDVQVYGNKVSGNRQGIVGVQTGVGSYLLQNLSVHDNIVTQAQGISGIDESVGSDAVFSRNNKWDRNTYYLSGNSAPFLWHYSNMGPSGWKSAGQDVSGTFQ